MTRFAIMEMYGPQDPRFAVHKFEAETGRDALAMYSMSQGFADPRPLQDEPDGGFFYTLPDGREGMVFTNTELVATPICGDCEKELTEADLRSTDPTRCDSCEQQAGFDATSEPRLLGGAEMIPIDNQTNEQIEAEDDPRLQRLDVMLVRNDGILPREVPEVSQMIETATVAAEQWTPPHESGSVEDRALERVANALRVLVNGDRLLADDDLVVRMTLGDAADLVEALTLFDSVDEGENTDSDRLKALADLIRKQAGGQDVLDTAGAGIATFGEAI